MLTFIPRTVTKDLLAELPDRSRRVLSYRFGLHQNGGRLTLEAIGREYGVTRERIRQIENHGLAAIRESNAYSAHELTIESLKKALVELGGFLSESEALAALAKHETDRNHLLFLLTVGQPFAYRAEDPNFHPRWHVDQTLAEAIERALHRMHDELEGDALIPESEFIQLFAHALKEEGVRGRNDEILPRWLSVSKRISRNPLGEWGRTESPHVRIKNTRDFAYLTLKRHGSPMHFTEVAAGIRKLFSREAHPATTHNELIKDKRFVLVGRGLYALKEWGYAPGVVRDVIANILDREGPLTRDEIIDRVKRERYVKDATIAVNLQSGAFMRLPDGRYGLQES